MGVVTLPTASIQQDQFVVGLDLSLRAAAVCAVPKDWKGDLNDVHMQVFGYSLPNDADERDRMRRFHEIAEGIVNFCRIYPVHASFIEQYAFSQSASHARSIAECGGIVKYRMYRKLGIVPTPIVASQARKILCGKLPRAKVKDFVIAQVRRLEGRAREWGPDETDAFVIANAGLERVGGVAITLAT